MICFSLLLNLIVLAVCSLFKLDLMMAGREGEGGAWVVTCLALGEHPDCIGHMQNMQKRQKEKEKKDQKRVALGLDIITYGVATTISSHLPMDWIPSQQVTAYSVQHQCKYKKLKIKKKKK
jgi:hypothetical protein